jgi:hypothetical protein
VRPELSSKRREAVVKEDRLPACLGRQASCLLNARTATLDMTKGNEARVSEEIVAQPELLSNERGIAE